MGCLDEGNITQFFSTSADLQQQAVIMLGTT